MAGARNFAGGVECERRVHDAGTATPPDVAGLCLRLGARGGAPLRAASRRFDKLKGFVVRSDTWRAPRARAADGQIHYPFGAIGRVTGLNLGADDYIPFSLCEVAARGCSVLRTHHYEDRRAALSCDDLECAAPAQDPHRAWLRSVYPNRTRFRLPIWHTFPLSSGMSFGSHFYCSTRCCTAKYLFCKQIFFPE